MKSRIKNIILSSLIFIFGACAHHSDVRPNADGIHRISLQADFKDASDQSSEAMKQANHYCKESGKQAFVVEEKCQYTGSMKESDYIAAKKAARAAEAVGDVLFGTNYGKHAKTGDTIGESGEAADDVIGKGYTYEMKFKCQ